MTIRDFIRKEGTVARNQGPRAAAEQGVVEVSHWVYTKYLQYRHATGDVIWNHDWDICVILDACRHDLMVDVSAEHDWLQGWRGESIWSVGSASPEWYGNTFAPHVVDDVDLSTAGVVTANPFSGKPAARAAGAPPGSLPLDRHELGLLDEVWRDTWGLSTEDGYLDVSPPEALTERAYHAWENADIDKLIVHYMQPHIPFRSRPEWFGRRENLQHFGEPSKEGGKDPWHRVRDGGIAVEEYLDAYRDNLEWVLPHVKDLYDSTGAKMLVTADHGNAYGEWGMWSHPPKVHIKPLRKVPAITLPEAAPTGALEGMPPPEMRGGEHSEEKLQALGYR